MCSSTRKLAAHHICRKSFLAEARFLTGNGITLCSKCHQSAHAGFNGRPDLSVPMDAQGCEKIDVLAELYGVLAENARRRGMLRNDYYHVSEEVLTVFKLLQDFDPTTVFPGYQLEQAYTIWRHAPQSMRNAMLIANGLAPIEEPMLGWGYISLE
jgi:hypothetical protein